MQGHRHNAGTSSLVALLIGSVLAGIVLWLVGGQTPSDFNDTALNKHTLSIFPVVNGHPIHVSETSQVNSLVEGWESRGTRPVLLWLGNSRLHAIKQTSPEAQPSSAKLFERLSEVGFDLLTFSLPNANQQEHYVLSEYLRHQFNLECLALPVVFDDFREIGIRSDLSSMLEATHLQLIETSAGQLIFSTHVDAAKPDQGFASVRNTAQETAERFLNNWLGSNVSFMEQPSGSRSLVDIA